MEVILAMYISKFENEFNSSRHIFRKAVKPCSAKEIAEVEESLSIRFPLAYKEFLFWGGKKAGGLFEGSDCFIDNLVLNQETAKEILKDDEFPAELPDKSLVFFMHQDYQFLFFITNESEDPAVFSYVEGQSDKKFTKVYSKYTEYLFDICVKTRAWCEEHDL